MAKSSRIGQRDTRIVIRAPTVMVDSKGNQRMTWADVFGAPVWCMWAGAYGTQVYENARMGEAGNATINMAYTDAVTNRCRVWKAGEPLDDAHAYEIVGEPNILGRRELEIKVRRLVVA
jgi:head-tail adaptor